MASLLDVQRALFPTARPLGAAALSDERGEREVGWVRVLKSRVPAFDALEIGDLALIPAPALAVVAPGPAQISELASALARARVPAVLLVDGETGHEALAALGRATTDAGLTTFMLGRVDPGGLERSVIAFLVNRRAELDRRAAELEAQLARLALQGQELDVLAAAIGEFTGRAVVIEGRRGDPIAIHAPSDRPAVATELARYLAKPKDGVALRVAIAGAPGEPGSAGRLVFLGDAPSTELERIIGERIAALLALELARDAALRQAREEPRRGESLPADGPPWVVILARQGVATGRDDIAARDVLRGELRHLAPSRRLVLRGTAESLEFRLVAATAPDDPTGLVIAERLAGFLGQVVALSEPFRVAGARAAAEGAARATLDASNLLADPPPVLRAARLPAYLILGNLHNLPDGLRQAQALLGPILVGRVEVQRGRLETLRALLGSASLGEAAARLGVHRNTVAYRVRRLESMADWDLADPDLRFVLELATRLMQNAQV